MKQPRAGTATGHEKGSQFEVSVKYTLDYQDLA